MTHWKTKYLRNEKALRRFISKTVGNSEHEITTLDHGFTVDYNAHSARS